MQIANKEVNKRITFYIAYPFRIFFNTLVYTYSISTVGRHIVVVGRVSKLDSVLTGFGLTTQGTFSIKKKKGIV